jgi:aspartyl-tRNA synthetase
MPNRKLSKELQFFHLRDSQGNILQLRSSLKELPPGLFSECPVAVTGMIRHRPKSQRRQGLADYELEIFHLHLFNPIQFTLPFQPSEAQSVNPATRAKYRYLDLRHKTNRTYLQMRDSIITSCRNFLHDQDFI